MRRLHGAQLDVPHPRTNRLSRRFLCQSGVATGLCCFPALRAAATALAERPLDLEEVAPGTFVSHGAYEEATRDNLGAIANVGFVVGRDGVAVIDTGGCRLWGERLREAIRRTTDRPILAVVQTHMHPDHTYGAAAFADVPRILGHHNLPRALADHAPYYDRGLRDALGELADGSRSVAPNETVADELLLDLGDRRLRLVAHAVAHTDNDLTVLDERTGILWTGDLLFVERCPALDGSITGWIGVLDRLRDLAITKAMPGHGPDLVDWPARSDPLLRYLTTVRDGVREVIKRGGTLEQAVATVGREERDRWLLFDDYHGRNVTAAFAELEWE